MIRPLTLAVALALVGCQSADVPRAEPTLAIPAAWRADVGPSPARWKACGGAIFTIARLISMSIGRCATTATS